VDATGFGWSTERTAKEVSDLRERFPVLHDSPEVFTRWLDLVQRFPVHGKRVHDARLVAILQAHAGEHLISFNTADFAEFQFLSPSIHTSSLIRRNNDLPVFGSVEDESLSRIAISVVAGSSIIV
jgi:hypothetical protein